MDQEEHTTKTISYIIATIVLTISTFDVYRFFQIINSLKRQYFLLSHEIFENCMLYQSICDLFILFFTFFIGISIFIYCFGITISENVFDKSLQSYLYFNYIIFGPYMTMGIILSFKYSDKLVYRCNNYNPVSKVINYRFLFYVMLLLTLTVTITFVASMYYATVYFESSVQNKITGNYFIGKFFWNRALNGNNFNGRVFNEDDINFFANNGNNGRNNNRDNLVLLPGADIDEQENNQFFNI